MAEKIVAPYSNKDIVEIIKQALVDGTIATNYAPLEDDETYVLKIVNGAIVLVKEEE